VIHGSNLIEKRIVGGEPLGKNISVYLDDDTIKWLDQLCGEWGVTRGKALALVLQQSRSMSEMLVGYLKTQNPKLSKQLSKMVKDSK
jgi:hypothetical protein